MVSPPLSYCHSVPFFINLLKWICQSINQIMLLYSLELSDGFPLHPNPHNDLPWPDLSLKHTPPSLGSKLAFFFSGPQTCHAHSCLNITNFPPGTLWFGAPWRHFSSSPWSKLLNAFPLRNCILYYYMIIYWFPCSLLVFPILSMSFKREGNFLSCSPLYALCPYIIGREKKST